MAFIFIILYFSGTYVHLGIAEIGFVLHILLIISYVIFRSMPLAGAFAAVRDTGLGFASHE